jgi:hypothetical protein
MCGLELDEESSVRRKRIRRKKNARAPDVEVGDHGLTDKEGGHFKEGRRGRRRVG